MVTVVPDGMLKKGGLIRNDLLPFDVQVDRYMVNSAEPVPPKPGDDNPATAGLGRKAVAVPKDPGVGVDPDQKVDIPSAYVTLLRKRARTSRWGRTSLTPYWDSQEVEAGRQEVRSIELRADARIQALHDPVARRSTIRSTPARRSRRTSPAACGCSTRNTARTAKS